MSAVDAILWFCMFAIPVVAILAIIAWRVDDAATTLERIRSDMARDRRRAADAMDAARDGEVMVELPRYDDYGDHWQMRRPR